MTNKYFYLVLLFAGCTVGLDVPKDVTISTTFNIADRCNVCIPHCIVEEGWFCKTSTGDDCDSNCYAGCLGAVAWTCREDGPHCLNRFGNGWIDVPVICTSVYSDDLSLSSGVE